MHKQKQELRPVDAPLYNYWQALYMAVYSPRLYVDVKKRWKGLGITYCLLLTVLLSIPLSVKYIYSFLEYFHDEITYPFEHMPNLYIQNGEVSIDKPIPYLVKDAKNNVVMVIDNNKNYMDLFDKYPHLNLIILKNKFYFNSPSAKINFLNTEKKIDRFGYSVDIGKSTNEIFSGSDLSHSNLFSFLKITFSISMIFLCWSVLFSLCVLLNFILSSVCRIISAIVLKYPIHFKDSFRMTLVASTAPLIVIVFFQIMGWYQHGFKGFYYFGAVAIYFSFGIFFVKRESKTMVHA